MMNDALKTYPLVETFHSVQGEGYWAGVSAFFIRLGGCDVFCPWCDQKETWNGKKYPQISVEKIALQVETANPRIVIVTGGEPLLHDLNPLTKIIKKTGRKIHLETSGSHPFSGDFDWVTFSPKPYKKPDTSIYHRVDELKAIVAEQSDLEWAESEAKKIPPSAFKYLQPEWHGANSQALVFEYIKQNPQWRLSLQTHKFIGIK